MLIVHLVKLAIGIATIVVLGRLDKKCECSCHCKNCTCSD